MGRNQRTRAKRRREARAGARGIVISQVHYGPALGEGVASASLEELEAVLSEQPADLNWTWAADRVIPVMSRIRPYPPGFPEPLRTIVEPGVAVGFAIDVGPAFVPIHADLIRGWGVTLADIHTRALSNTIARAASIRPKEIVHGSVGGAPTRWLQTGKSIGSVLVLVPDQLGRIFGPAPALFITPMRDLIIGLPADGEPDLAFWLWSEVASDDPNCLAPVGYRFDGTRLVPEALDDGGRLDEPSVPRQSFYVA